PVWLDVLAEPQISRPVTDDCVQLCDPETALGIECQGERVRGLGLQRRLGRRSARLRKLVRSPHVERTVRGCYPEVALTVDCPGEKPGWVHPWSWTGMVERNT